MLSPCVKCHPLKCVLGDRKKDCLASYPNLRRIGNSEGGFAKTEEDPATWPEFERNFYLKQIGRASNMEIDSDIPPPAETGAAPAPAPAAPKKRGRKPGTKNAPSQSEQLQAALEFVSPVNSDLVPFGEFVNLSGNMAVMFNGQMAAGHPITEELTLCPQLERLQAALKRCGKTLVITETDAGQLSIKGDKLRALVPCLAQELPAVAPDAPILEGDFEILKEAFKVCGTLASEKGERVVEASLLLDGGACTGTNGHAMLQYWHGITSLPPGTVLPKVFAAAIAKQAKKITGIGGNWNGEFLTSITFWFEGGAWLRTQTYEDRWPNLAHILDVPSAPVPVPNGLFDAIDAVTQFIDEKQSSAIYFVPDAVQSHPEASVGAQYEVKGLPGGKAFNGKLVKQISPFVTAIDLATYPDKAMIFGGNQTNPIRGACMGMRVA